MRFSDYLLAAFSGALTALAFPKIEASFFVWISLIPLFFLLDRLRPKRAFLAGWTAGTFFYGVLLYWIPAVPAHYGHLPFVLSVLVYLVLVLFLALFWAFFALVFAVVRVRMPGWAFWLAPFLWVALELGITRILTGFPWGLLGLSQYKNLSFIQIAGVTGIYGVSFVLISFQSLFVYSIRSAKRLPFACGTILLVAVHLAGFLVLGRVRETPETFPAAVIQGNVSSDVYWKETPPAEILTLFEDHLALTRQAAEQGAQLIVWPEFTVPMCFSCDDPLYKSFKEVLTRYVRESGRTLLLGTNETSGTTGRPLYYNTALCLGPDRDVTRYAKMHLVPFGEYTPYKPIFGFIDRVTHAIGEVTPGTEFVLHTFAGEKFGTPICYEIIFPDLVRRFTKCGADFLVTITNDGWYGTTSAPYQHFANAIFRAVENRRFLLRAATTGVSGIVDPYGRIVSSTAVGEKTTLTGRVTPSHRPTFYARFGDLFAGICLTISAGTLILAPFHSRP
jgi:apolipoprotein N-acyltransferase